MATPIPDNEARFTGEEIVAATGAEGALDGEVRGVYLDSRRATVGCLFVALRGETHDAHDYVAQAVDNGATAVLVDRPVDVDAAVLVVDDTRRALGALAAMHRQRFSPTVIGVTGSVGKTTTKELIGAGLRGLGLTPLVTRGNLNNRVGVPMTLLTLDASHDAAVIEMGMNEPGEIADLAAMVAPTIGIVTAVAEVHTEGVGGIEGVAREKSALLEALDATGVAVFNADDAPLVRRIDALRAETRIGFGRAEAADLRLVDHAIDENGTNARFSWRGAELEARMSLLGIHAALDAAGALAVIAGLDERRLGDAAGALSSVEPPPHRMAPLRIGPLLVIDDVYNASPRSVKAALETCGELARARGGALIAVLGDMLELGHREEVLHEEVGRAAIDAGAKAVIACGERMTHAGRAALKATMESGGPTAKVVLLRDVGSAAECIREVAGPRDVVLVKGSRGMQMERVITALEGEE